MVAALTSQIPTLDKKNTFSSKENKNVLEYLQGLYDKCITARVSFEQQWYTNMSFYFGKHYVEWAKGTSGQRLVEPPAPSYRVRLTINRCRRIIRTELTKVTRQVPQWYVIPNTTEEEDRAGAQAAEQIGEYELRELKYNRKLRTAAHWMTICGTSFLKTSWDPVGVDPSGVQGKICIDPITAFHLYVPDIQEEDIEKQGYVVQESLLDQAAVKQMYGVDVEANAETRGGALEQRFMSAMGIKAGQGNKKVLCHEIWLKPNQKYPKGAFGVWTGKELLFFQDSWPYTNKEFPFAKLDHLPTGRFYGDSMLVDLIPLQKEVNRTHSQIVESKNKMAKPQWRAQKGAVDPTKMTAEPGLIIQYTPGFQAPEPVQPPSLPSYVMQDLQLLETEMDDLAATGEITKGNVPPGITAASAISYLQEENDNRFAPTVASIEEATEKVGRQLLSLVNDYWDQERKVKVVGDNNLTDVMIFSKSDLADNTDFTVEAGSAAPRSRASRQAFIIELVKMGMIDQKQGLKYLDMVETGELYQQAQLDTRQVQRENLKMKEMGQMTPSPMMADPTQIPGLAQQIPQVDPMTGQPMQPQLQQFPINDYDDDNAHIVGHGNYMKREEFEQWDPNAKQVLINHWNAHKDRVQQQMQDQLQAQQLAQANQPQPISQRQVPTDQQGVPA